MKTGTLKKELLKPTTCACGVPLAKGTRQHLLDLHEERALLLGTITKLLWLLPLEVLPEEMEKEMRNAINFSLKKY